MLNANKMINSIMEPLTVYWNGKVNMYLNPLLVMKQGLTEKEIETLKALHLIRLGLFDTLANTECRRLLRAGVILIEQCEFAMQRAWRFEENVNYHSWWYHTPHCSCPKIDNEERYGTGAGKVINKACILHGGIE